MTPLTHAKDAPPPGSFWTFWQNPDTQVIGEASYSWSFLLKVDLPVLLGLLVLFALPPVQGWTGCDLRIIAAGFFCHFLHAVATKLYGLSRIDPRIREYFSHLVNTIAAVSIPLSSHKPLFALWALYPLIVWMDGYGSPKSVGSLMVSMLLPWIDPLAHLGHPEMQDKLVLAGVSVVTGFVIYLIASYFTDWARRGQLRRAEARAEEESARAAQAERERIGRGLHGTLGAALSEIALWQEVALAGGQTIDPNDPIARAQARARSALTELRSLVAGMDEATSAPSTLSALAECVRRQASGLCDAAGVTFALEVEGEAEIESAKAYHAAKAVVEAVTNAVRHGRPRAVSVILSAPLSLMIADDGQGFDPDHAAPGRGLRSLREHAEAIGADSMSSAALEAALGVAGHVVAASCADGESALAALERSEGGFHAAIVDMRLPGMTGPETIRALREHLPELPVLVLTVFEDPDIILAAIQAGASGYLLKGSPLSEICGAVEQITEGLSPLSQRVARHLLDHLRPTKTGARPPAESAPNPPSNRLASLSEREQEVLDLLARGQSYAEIAVALGLGVGTVQTYVKRIYRKLEVSSKAEAAWVARRDK
jgi:two-component system nitrate/nitrite response regulator NarL